MTTFVKESEFAAAVIHELRQRGWGDALQFGKEVSLKIYDRHEIAAPQ